jgi:hypothetical protein
MKSRGRFLIPHSTFTAFPFARGAPGIDPNIIVRHPRPDPVLAFPPSSAAGANARRHFF